MARACERAPHLTLLVGYLALCDGDLALARETLSTAPAPAGLAPFQAFYLGEAQFYGRDPAAAALSFDRALKTAPGWMLPRLRARMGEALLAANNPAAAAPLLEKAVLEQNTPELYWQRSLARRAVGNLDGERADLRALALHFPSHPYAVTALQKLEAGKKPLVLTFDERLVRARGFLDVGSPAAALEELATAERQKVARGASAKARLAFVKALALYASGDAERGDRTLEDARRGQSSVAAEALMLKARRALKANDHKAARAAFLEVDRKYPKEPPADDAAFLAAWLDSQDEHYGEAIKAFDAFAKRHPTSRKRDEAMWWKGLALLRSGKGAESKGALEALISTFPRSSLVPQARYWAARATQLSAKPGEVSEAMVSAFQAITLNYPGNLYALLASERLRELGRPLEDPFAVAPRSTPGALPDELRLATLLAGTGLLRDAAEEAQVRLQSVRTPEEALRYGQALQAIGEFGAAHTLAARLLWGQAYSAKLPAALALMYPRAFASTVEREAKTQGVDPYLIWAIMRRESAFRPEAQSAVSARGLMQIMSYTATSISTELAIDAPDPDELFSPELSIRLSAWYLAALMKRFHHPAVCAAAYNAGPVPAARWVAQSGVPLDLWIEQIPFKETRAYVKQVTADYSIYHSLYTADAGSPRIGLLVPAPEDGGVNF